MNTNPEEELYEAISDLVKTAQSLHVRRPAAHLLRRKCARLTHAFTLAFPARRKDALFPVGTYTPAKPFNPEY